MKEHPILFSTEMVKAILAGRKTMTRRIVKPQPDDDGLHNHTKFPMSLQSDLQGWWGTVDETGETKQFNCRYGYDGHLLFVREAWAPKNISEEPPGELAHYRVSDEFAADKWKPSIHMPKEVSRIWLEVKNVRVQRLHDISPDDVLKEGIVQPDDEKELANGSAKLPSHFFNLWDSINGKESWKKNPWVWVVEFKVLSTTGKPVADGQTRINRRFERNFLNGKPS